MKGFRQVSTKNVQQINRKLGELAAQMKKANAVGDYPTALSYCKQAIALAPNVVVPYIDATAICCHLRQWKEAVNYGLQALKLKGDTFALYDGLSHAYGAMYDFEKMKYYGLIALNKRDATFGKTPQIPWNVHIEHNHLPKLISFSLFGKNPKYCEGTILNAEKMKEIYPDFKMVVFYDDSVLEHVLVRLLELNVQCIKVDDKWQNVPGPMWRFLAYDLPNSLVIFRDVDSLISIAEQKAVQEWIDSDKAFHHIRDGASHTELILAGLWGVKYGALPPMHELLELFLKKPIESEHFADQYFLREFVYPYMKQSLYASDSKFGFGEVHPLPIESDYKIFHIGMTEKLGNLATDWDKPNGTVINYIFKAGDKELFYYPAVIKNKKAVLELPAVLIPKLQSGEWMIHFEFEGENDK